jgi:hypothetical protein
MRFKLQCPNLTQSRHTDTHTPAVAGKARKGKERKDSISLLLVIAIEVHCSR